jgi:hypothetical protein
LLIVGGTIKIGISRTSSVCAAYWISSNTGVRKTTAPGVAAMVVPTSKPLMSTMLGTRGRRDASLTSAFAPRTRFAPRVSMVALVACGFRNTLLGGDNASTRFPTSRRRRLCVWSSSSASSTSCRTVLPVAR